jgi:hypothetical protein
MTVAGAVKIMLKHTGKAVAATVPATQLVRLGLPALAAVFALAVLVLALACWVINSDDRTKRVTQIILARAGDASVLAPGRATQPLAPQLRRRLWRRHRPATGPGPAGARHG